MKTKTSAAHTLHELFAGMAAVEPSRDTEIAGLSLDSRAIQHGDCFFACSGTAREGTEFIGDAIRAGAVAVAVDQQVSELSLDPRIPVVKVRNLKSRLGLIADRFYGSPSHHLRVIGVTGTNGKTSVSHFIAEALSGSPKYGPCGLIGTLGYGLWGALEPPATTTPDSISLHRLMAEMLDHQAHAVAMEVSSHGLAQGRVSGVAFDIAVFTNLSRDHLDYHGTMEDYGETKRLLFQSRGLRAAVINLDDPWGREILAGLPAGTRAVGYSLEEARSPEFPSSVPLIEGRLLAMRSEGLTMDIVSPAGCGTLKTQLLGRFNAYNLLAALGVLIELGMPFATAIERLSRVSGVPGRLERFGGRGRPLVVVDYAHTPDGLEQALYALRDVCGGRLWCVFGCGGDRDPGKRPLMAQVAEELADQVIVTSDNPRGEDPMAIIEEILSGMRHRKRVRVEPDRAEAIALAIRQASRNDVVLIAGKGHETYQEIAGQRLPFSDREVVRHLLVSRRVAA
jgi:UDP-N-acetylmuramoyl-L-alanyl-D-glutamate--2,6-diaminopimelate ligase